MTNTVTAQSGHGQQQASWSPRSATKNDKEASERLLQAAGLTIEGLDHSFPDGYAVVENEEAVVGIIGVESYGTDGLVRSLAVHPDWQGQRVGEALLRDRMAWSKAGEFESLYLITEVPAYFARFGFRIIDRDVTPGGIKGSVEYTKVCPESAPVMTLPLDDAPHITREDVRDKYASYARKFTEKEQKEQASCCGPSDADASCGCGTAQAENPVTSNLYSADELAEIPESTAKASLGCGNPTALAELHEGEMVLDLGSGGGIDVMLSARRVGPTGKAYGLDMTDEMLAIARENQRKAGVENVEFLKGEIENIPLPDNSVDVIISNCVINLSTDKPRVLREAFRVLKPGGRFAVSDIVSRGEVPEVIRRDAELWAGCIIAGTLEEKEYTKLLAEAGFETVEVVPTRVYTTSELCGFKSNLDDEVLKQADGKFMSAFVRATKPA